MPDPAAPLPWLAIIGIGEDGVEGLSAAARQHIGNATRVFGGARHLALAASLIRGTALPWRRPLADSLPDILAARGQNVAVLASGDPMWHGIGATLGQHVPAEEMLCLPSAPAFSLACARLGWPLAQVLTLSFCGQDVAGLRAQLQPGRRILALSADAQTPKALAEILRAQGYGASVLHVLEHLGGPQARARRYLATERLADDIAALNLVAIEAVAGADAQTVPLAPGLPEHRFAHDGQISKWEIRAIILAALGPCAGELLWDVGAGSGAVGIEWLLRHPANRAIAVEHVPDRLARIAGNAQALGVPGLRIVAGAAPASLAGLPPPDAVFIGGGASADTLRTCWAALRPGGRLVANAVTVETETLLIDVQFRLGGQLTRIDLARLDRIGPRHGFRPAMTITQWAAVKP